ncbi:MAG: hypothetical protein Kow00121_54380 [Elainellaceae cyanobacterium]
MDSSMSRMAIDNLIRRELKVSDPNDASQVAQALLTRYKDNPRAIAINREAQGVPFLLAPSTAPVVQQTATSSDTEMQQAITDVERDLQELTTNTLLKDVTPELQGWAIAVRTAIQEGATSARFALDPRQRDKTFGIRRTLGDYARIARLVGALTPTMNAIYRKFAQSLDEVASVLLVMMGEALSNVGFGGRYLLQAPYSELQIRRDAVVYALRNLVGAAQESYDQNTWPRGIDAYRQLFQYLEQQGQGDLRALLVENELVRVMDALIQRSGQGSIEGLRQLGATAQLDIERLRRMVIVGNNSVNPKAPPLAAFLEALQLFVDAFDPAGGPRLLRIARPPILFYGLYGMTAADPAEERLLKLIIERNQLADRLDCYLGCGCTADYILCQIVLDKVLYDVDRAIDLYAVGTQDKSNPEYRAVAYSYLVDVILHPASSSKLEVWEQSFEQALTVCLTPQSSAEINYLNHGYLKALIKDSLSKVREYLYSPVGIAPSGALSSVNPLLELPDKTKVQDLVRQELQIQGEMEQRWINLVQTMVPSCIPFNQMQWKTNSTNRTTRGSFDVMQDLIQKALKRALGQSEKLSVQFFMPNNYEDSLKDIADAVRGLASADNPITQQYEDEVEP